MQSSHWKHAISVLASWSQGKGQGLIPDRKTVTTRMWITPCNYRSICQNGSKCTSCGLNQLHIPELIPDSRTVTTGVSITPRNYRSICQNGGKCRALLSIKSDLVAVRALNHLHTKLIRKAEMRPSNP